MADRYSAAELVTPFCAQLGITVERVLARASLPPDWLDQPITSVGPAHYFRIWEAVRDEADIPDFEVAVAKMMVHGAFSPMIFAFSCSETVAIGLERLAIFKPIVGPTRIALRREAVGLRVTITFADGEYAVPHAYELMELVFKLECIRTFSAHPVEPLALTVTRDAPCPENIAAVLGVPVGSGGVSLLLSHEEADRPLVSRSPALWDTLEPALQRRLDEVSPVTTSRVRDALETGLSGGATTLEEIARRLNTSKRSLQRRLSDEGVQFQTLLGDVRQRQAKAYLRGSGLSLPEISHLLGYRDTASFFRAFQGWTGTTPAAFRKEF